MVRRTLLPRCSPDASRGHLARALIAVMPAASWRKLIASSVSITFLLLMVQGCSAAQTTPRNGARVSPPFLQAVTEYYPLPAKRLGMTGRVSLEYSIDASGRAHNIVVTESAGPAFDESAKRLLADGHYKVPSDWAKNGDYDRRFTIGVIFELQNKPRVPPFEGNMETIVIQANGPR
jgi:TonB family protein